MGVETDTSVGEELRRDGGMPSSEEGLGRGMGASRRWQRERSPRLASSSNIEGELEGGIPCKDSEAGYHPTGEMLHRTPMLVNKMIKLSLKLIKLY